MHCNILLVRSGFAIVRFCFSPMNFQCETNFSRHIYRYTHAHNNKKKDRIRSRYTVDWHGVSIWIENYSLKCDLIWTVKWMPSSLNESFFSVEYKMLGVFIWKCHTYLMSAHLLSHLKLSQASKYSFLCMKLQQIFWFLSTEIRETKRTCICQFYPCKCKTDS